MAVEHEARSEASESPPLRRSNIYSISSPIHAPATSDVFGEYVEMHLPPPHVRTGQVPINSNRSGKAVARPRAEISAILDPALSPFSSPEGNQQNDLSDTTLVSIDTDQIPSCSSKPQFSVVDTAPNPSIHISPTREPSGQEPLSGTAIIPLSYNQILLSPSLQGSPLNSRTTRSSESNISQGRIPHSNPSPEPFDTAPDTPATRPVDSPPSSLSNAPPNQSAQPKVTNPAGFSPPKSFQQGNIVSESHSSPSEPLEMTASLAKEMPRQAQRSRHRNFGEITHMQFPEASPHCTL